MGTRNRRIGQRSVVFVCEFCGNDFSVAPSEAARHAVRFCSRYCRTRKGTGPNLPPEERFWRAVDRSGGPEACWPWQLSVRGLGYGQVWWEGRPGRKAHRVAFFLANGYWPKNVLHHCDNPVCCNPAHLYAGSLKRNAQDAVRRRRMLVGELNGSAKLTEADVLAIRASSDWHKTLAARYGVGIDQISRIKRRVSWRHVTAPPTP